MAFLCYKDNIKWIDYTVPDSLHIGMRYISKNYYLTTILANYYLTQFPFHCFMKDKFLNGLITAWQYHGCSLVLQRPLRVKLHRLLNVTSIAAACIYSVQA